MHHIGRKTVAEVARLAIESMQNIDGRYKTDGINGLIESFRRIEDNPQWTPEQALQDHFDAMTAIAMNLSELTLLKSQPALFQNCESMLRYLTKVENARVRLK